MATVLELVQQAYSELGLPQPASLLTSGQIELQAKNLLYAEARYLRNIRKFPQQKKAYSFNLEASRSQYPLPQDFYSKSGDTEWDQTAHLPLIGPISDAYWNERLYGYVLVGQPYGFRVFGPDANPNTTQGQFIVNPTPGTGVTDTISFEYLTKNLFLPKFWAASTVFAAGAYCSASGKIYKTTAGGTTGATIPTHTSGSASDGAVTWTFQGSAYETVIADTDMCIFDDDIVIAGLKFRYRKSKDQDFSEDKREHDEMLNKAVSRWTGGFRGRMGSGYRGPRFTVPEGNWDI